MPSSPVWLGRLCISGPPARHRHNDNFAIRYKPGRIGSYRLVHTREYNPTQYIHSRQAQGGMSEIKSSVFQGELLVAQQLFRPSFKSIFFLFFLVVLVHIENNMSSVHILTHKSTYKITNKISKIYKIKSNQTKINIRGFNMA